MRDAHLTEPTRVAVIDPTDGDPTGPLVRWHDLPPDTAHTLPDVPSLAWIGPHATDVSTRARTALRRQRLRMGRLLVTSQTLREDQPVGGFTRIGDQRRLAFGAVPLAGRRYHLFVRDVTDQVDLTAFRAIRIDVGCCLFGGTGVRFRGPDGDRGCPTVAGLDAIRIHTIDVTDELGVYELETILRIVAVVRDLLAELPRTIPVELILDTPRIQYYPYLLEGYVRGLIPHRVLLQWWNEVDQRQLLVLTELRTQLRAALWAAGRPDARIETSPGLDAAACVLRDAISAGWPTRYGHRPQQHLTHVMTQAMLASPHGAEWQRLLEHIAPPDTLVDLALASYTWQLARPALAQHDGPVLTLMIDDISEHRLYTVARRTAAAIRQRHHTTQDPHPVAGIFPLRSLFTAGADGTHSLYHNVHAHQFRTTIGEVLTAQQLAAAVTQPWHTTTHVTDQPAREVTHTVATPGLATVHNRHDILHARGH